MAKFKVVYTVWYEVSDELFQKTHNYYVIDDLEEAIAIAKSLVNEYDQVDGYCSMFELSDRHFGTYREDRINGFADGIRAWVE